MTVGGLVIWECQTKVPDLLAMLVRRFLGTGPQHPML